MIAAAMGFALNVVLEEIAIREWGGVFRSCLAV